MSSRAEGRGSTRLYYDFNLLPMQEVLRYLRSNGYKAHIERASVWLRSTSNRGIVGKTGGRA